MGLSAVGSSDSFTPEAPIDSLTDNSGGTAGDTINAIADVPTRDAVASLNAKLDAVLAVLRADELIRTS